MQHWLGFGSHYISKPAGHAGSKIQPYRAKHQHDAAGHVFAAVLSDAFHYGKRTAVAHREAFTGASRDEELPSGGTVQHGIARKHVAATGCSRTCRDRDRAAGEPLANVVIGLAV